MELITVPTLCGPPIGGPSPQRQRRRCSFPLSSQSRTGWPVQFAYQQSVAGCPFHGIEPAVPESHGNAGRLPETRRAGPQSSSSTAAANGFARPAIYVAPGCVACASSRDHLVAPADWCAVADQLPAETRSPIANGIYRRLYPGPFTELSGPGDGRQGRRIAAPFRASQAFLRH